MQLRGKVISGLLLWYWALTSIPEVVCKLEYISTSSSHNHPLSAGALKSYLTRLMSHNVSARSCPAPKFPVSEDDCQIELCSDDRSCATSNQSCCFNGCVFTCTERLSPPPVIDWEDEPVVAAVTSEQDTAVRRCTTSPRPAPSEPVGCPEGYVCRIQDYGDPLIGTGSSGICVPRSSTDTTLPDDTSNFREKTRKETVYLPGGCVLSQNQYKHMQDFMTRAYVVDCFCIGGSVECQVSL